jgi:hypothetical protein
VTLDVGEELLAQSLKREGDLANLLQVHSSRFWWLCICVMLSRKILQEVLTANRCGRNRPGVT